MAAISEYAPNNLEPLQALYILCKKQIPCWELTNFVDHPNIVLLLKKSTLKRKL